MAANVGTAYVRVIGDLSTLNKQLVANFHPARLGRLGKAAGVALGAGVAAGIVGKAAFDLGEQFDEQFDKIRTGTGATGKALKGLQGDFKDVLKTVPADFDTVGTAVTKLNQRLGITGKPLQRLSRQLIQLSKITGTDIGENVEAATRLFGDWSVASGRQADTLDKLFRTSQKTGIGITNLTQLLVKFGAPFRALGFTLDESAALLGKWEKEGVNLQTTLPGLRMGLRNMIQPSGKAAEALNQLGVKTRDPQKALPQIIKSLRGMKDESRASALAMQIFGTRAGPDMARAIIEGRFSIDDLVDTIGRGRDTIDKAEKDTRDFGEQWQLLKNRVFVGLEPIASRFFKTIGDGMEALATADFSKIAADLDLGKVDTAAFEESARNIRDIVRALGPVWDFFGDVAKREIAAVSQIFRGMGQVIRGVTRAISALLRGDFKEMWSGIKLAFRGGVNQALGLLRLMTSPVREIGARIGRGLLSVFREAWQTVRSVFSRGVSAALDRLRGMIRGAASLGESIGRALVRGFTRGIRGFVDVGKAILGAIKDGLAGATIVPKIKIDPPGPGSFEFGPVKIPEFAKGGRMKRRGLALVGEEGPELVHLPTGAEVKTARETKRFIGGPETFGDSPVRASLAFNSAVRFLAELMREKFGLRVTSGVRAGDTGSFHAVGKAVDVAGPRMREAAEYVKDSGLYRTLLEGIHNPNLSSDNGRLVSPGVWGVRTWADHRDHIHLAANTISAAVKQKLDSTGGPDRRKEQREAITGGRLSLGQMVTLAKKAGFPDPALAAAVGYAESRGRVRAVGDGGDSIGLWQINMPAHPRYKRNDLFNAEKNAKAALQISGRGKNWRPWTQHRNGAYKQFLGGRATPLPKGEGGGSQTAEGSSYADLIALRLEETADTPGLKDDLKWINRGLRYWRGVYRRNKRMGNFARANEALSQVKDLRTKKKDLREKPEDEVFQLGGLSVIGKPPKAWNISSLQGTLDAIELDIARSALTESLDNAGNVTPQSYSDDIAAATRLVSFWNDLWTLASGVEIPRKIFNRKGQLVDVKERFEGTTAQKIEAAQNLKSAKDSLRSIQDEAKSEVPDAQAIAESADLPTGPSAQEEIKSFLNSISSLFRDFRSNFRPLPFQRGGIVPGIGDGDKVHVLAEPGEAFINKTAVRMLGGPKAVDKINRIFPRFDSPKAKTIGYQTGGVVTEKRIASTESKVINVTNNFKTTPEDPHSWSRQLEFELRTAI